MITTPVTDDPQRPEALQLPGDAVHIESPTVSATATAAPARTVAGHRSLYVLIAVAALAVVALLIWQPWDRTGTEGAERDADPHAGHTVAPGEEPLPSAIRLTPQQMSGLRIDLTTIERKMLPRRLEIGASVEYDEAAHTILSARYAGRIEKLYVNRTGEHVRAGAPVAEIYSSDLAVAQGDYLLALKVAAELEGPASDLSGEAATARHDREERLLLAARRRLELLGMTSAQIARLQQSGEIPSSVTLYAPASGVVMTRGVTTGAYVNVGGTIVDLIDLSSVWVIAQVFETDANRIHRGMSMRVTGEALDGDVLTGIVDYVYPTVDPQKRTVKVRARFGNARGILRPGMYLDAVIEIAAEETLVVPVDAVLRTGRRDLVYVAVGPTTFEPREVTLGAQGDGFYQIRSGGVKEGDRVVAHGGFLLDSESRLSKSGGGHAGH